MISENSIRTSAAFPPRHLPLRATTPVSVGWLSPLIPTPVLPRLLSSIPDQALAPRVSVGATEKSALQVAHLGTVAGETWGLSCCGFTRPSMGAGLALAGVYLHFTPLACGGGGVRCHTHCLSHRLLPYSWELAQHKLYKMTRLPCGQGLSGCPRSAQLCHRDA